MASASVFVEAQAQTMDAVVELLITRLQAIWRGVMFWDEEAVDSAILDSIELVEMAQRHARRLTNSYNKSLFDALGEVFPDNVAPETAAYPRFNVTPEEVWRRPANQFYYMISQGYIGSEALDSVITRVQQMAEAEIQLARRDQAARIYSKAGGVIGYRRVVRPEMSRTGVCGMCLVASDRIYSTDELMPIHEHCKCETAPVTASHDPGSAINAEDLQRLYGAGGSTSAKDLKAIRVKDFKSSELGPVLTTSGKEIADGETREKRAVRKTSERDKEFQAKGKEAREVSFTRTPEFTAEFTRRRIAGIELWMRRNQGSENMAKIERLLAEQQDLLAKTLKEIEGAK